jgi:hypothetical protein
VLDPQYVVARSVLSDALDALGDQRDAIIVVGGQDVVIIEAVGVLDGNIDRPDHDRP